MIAAIGKQKDLAALVGADGWARLPCAVARRFAEEVAEAAYAGEGRFEANWAGRLFALLGALFGRPLPWRCGAARVFIRTHRTASGERWTRIYCFEHGEEIVRSVKRQGQGCWLEERAGPIVMRLKVFEAGGALVFDCSGFAVRLGPVTLPLPLALTPGRIRVEHRDLGGGRCAFSLEARHPWFGRTFRQTCTLTDLGA